MATSTTRASALLLLLLAAPAGAQDDAGRVDPVTGGPRQFLDPTSSEEAEANLRACLDRALIVMGAGDAVRSCQSDILARCAAVMALYPLARDECALEARLAWSPVRNDAGLALYDLLRARGDEAGAAAFSDGDEAWRIENGNACVTADGAAHDACTLGREMDRAALYLGQAAKLAGGLGALGGGLD